MRQYFCGIMSPVAYLKEVFLYLSSFYYISMTYLTLESNAYMFADDIIIIYRPITSHDNIIIQNDLNNINGYF